MRTFIAVELPGYIKELLYGLGNELRKSGADVKWIEKTNMHLTLKFLGEIAEDRLKDIRTALEEATVDCMQFKIRLNSCGAFPNPSHPRIIWAGEDKGEKEASDLFNRIEDKLSALGIPKEDRPFTSHITLGRVRSFKNREALSALIMKGANFFENKNAEFTIYRLIILKSVLTPKGAVYEALSEINLKTT